MIGVALIFAALSVAAGTLAFRFAKVLSLHLIAYWIFFALLPTLTLLITDDNTQLQAKILSYFYLHFIYLGGIAVVALCFRDRKILADIQKTLRDVEISHAKLLLFVVLFVLDFGIRVTYNFLGSGMYDADTAANIPYFINAIFFVSSTLLVGLFCYACLFIRQNRIALVVALAYMGYSLIIDGRRSLILAILAFALLLTRSVNINFSRRFVIVTAVAAFVFVMVGPVFLELRFQSQILRDSYGLSAIQSFTEALRITFANLLSGQSGFFDTVSKNVAERGSAGLFFLNVVDGLPQQQHGHVLMQSFEWILPSAIAAKPLYQAEQVIQLLIGVPLTDDANSLPTTLYADFGAPGVFLAGAFNALFLYSVIRFISRHSFNGLVPIYLLGVFFYISFRVEDEPVGYLQVMRDVAILAVLSTPAALIRWSREKRKPPPEGESEDQNRSALGAALP